MSSARAGPSSCPPPSPAPLSSGPSFVSVAESGGGALRCLSLDLFFRSCSLSRIEPGLAAGLPPGAASRGRRPAAADLVRPLGGTRCPPGGPASPRRCPSAPAGSAAGSSPRRGLRRRGCGLARSCSRACLLLGGGEDGRSECTEGSNSSAGGAFAAEPLGAARLRPPPAADLGGGDPLKPRRPRSVARGESHSSPSFDLMSLFMSA